MAFIVDGQLEKKVIQRLCGGAPVRTTNLNGKSVNISAIVDKIETLIKLLKGRYYPIVIIVDREQRVEASIAIEARVLDMLAEKGFRKDDIIVSCPDRMIENWILAGTTTFKGSTTNIPVPQQNPDECHGKGILKGFLATHKLPYVETTTGVEMFCSIDFATAAGRSASFGRLHARLKPYCPWILT